MIAEKEANEGAFRVTTRMRALGVQSTDARGSSPFKDAHGFHAVAGYFNFPDWNRIIAAIRSEGGGEPKSKDGHSREMKPPVESRRAAGQRELRTHMLLA